VGIHEGSVLMSHFRNSGSGAHYQRKITAEEESRGKMSIPVNQLVSELYLVKYQNLENNCAKHVLYHCIVAE